MCNCYKNSWEGTFLWECNPRFPLLHETLRIRGIRLQFSVGYPRCMHVPLFIQIEPGRDKNGCKGAWHRNCLIDRPFLPIFRAIML